MRTVLDRSDRAQARYSSARGELLAAVAELDQSGEWRGHGAGNLSSFLAARWQISLASARELVRDAKALTARPALAGALREGSVSIDQAKALSVLCREGTDDDEVWLETLWSWSYPEIEREARKETARKLERTDDGVYLRTSHTKDERYLRGEFQLHPDDGAQVVAAIEARVPKETSLRTWDHACALSLVEMAKASLEDGVSKDALSSQTQGGPAEGDRGVRSGTGRALRPTVLVSMGADILQGAGGDGVASVGGGFVGPETAQRLACDASLQPLLRDLAGRIIATGPSSRTIPPYLRRAVEERDGGTCTFPGCGRTSFLECHHIIWVANWGPTELWNLTLVCWHHHKLLHEGRWRLEGPAGPHITWIRPDGAPFEPRVRVVLDTC